MLIIRKNHFSTGSSSANCTTVSFTLSCVAVASASDSSLTAGDAGEACFSSDFAASGAPKDVSKRVVGLTSPTNCTSVKWVTYNKTTIPQHKSWERFPTDAFVLRQSKFTGL